MVAFWAAILAANSILISRYLSQLWGYPQYQYFPILFGGMLWLAWQRGLRWSTLKTACDCFYGKYLLPITVALGLLLFASAVFSPALAFLAFTIVLLAPVWKLADTTGIRLFSTWALFWLMFRIPLNLDMELVQQLQLISSKFSSYTLDLIGVNHLMTGNSLHLAGGHDLFVDEACSGVVSLFSIIAVVATYCVYMRHQFAHFLLLLPFSMFLAVLLNLLRITIITTALAWYDIDLVHGIVHSLLGLGLFTIVVMGLLLIDQWLSSWMAPIPEPDTVPNPLVRFWNSWVANSNQYDDAEWEDEPDKRHPAAQSIVPHKTKSSLAGTMVVAILAISALGVSILRWSESPNRVGFESDNIALMRSASLEQLLQSDFQVVHNELEQRERGSDFGQYSRLFHVQSPQGTVTFSIDFPFPDHWHELTQCYILTGWTLEDRQVADQDWQVVSADLINPQQHGYLVFSICENDGTYVDSPTYQLDSAQNVARTFMGRLWNRFAGNAQQFTSSGKEQIQFQLWCPRSIELKPEDKSQLKALFIELRDAAHKAMFSKAETKMD